MPLFRKNNVGAISWGFVSGKTSTIFGWDVPRPDGREPAVWFHDILRQDKIPFDAREIEIIKKINSGNYQDNMCGYYYESGSWIRNPRDHLTGNKLLKFRQMYYGP